MTLNSTHVPRQHPSPLTVRPAPRRQVHLQLEVLAVACENVPQIALQLTYLIGTTPTHYALPTLSIAFSSLALVWRFFKKMLGYVAGVLRRLCRPCHQQLSSLRPPLVAGATVRGPHLTSCGTHPTTGALAEIERMERWRLNAATIVRRSSGFTSSRLSRKRSISNEEAHARSTRGHSSPTGNRSRVHPMMTMEEENEQKDAVSKGAAVRLGMMLEPRARLVLSHLILDTRPSAAADDRGATKGGGCRQADDGSRRRGRC